MGKKAVMGEATDHKPIASPYTGKGNRSSENMERDIKIMLSL